LKEVINKKTKEVETLTKQLEQANKTTSNMSKVEEYEDKIKTLTKKLEEINITTKKFIENMQYAHQREQRLMSSVVLELGHVLSQTLHKKNTLKLSHQNLIKLINKTQTTNKTMLFFSLMRGTIGSNMQKMKHLIQ